MPRSSLGMLVQTRSGAEYPCYIIVQVLINHVLPGTLTNLLRLRPTALSNDECGWRSEINCGTAAITHSPD
jgi:hypothetical protein